ncbi:DNA-directed DNA polymerase [Lithospermum erythrorhizon]|uniref:DNA-directed DNA polymerase n=1 Tax=Lithospermum erythrorhizon TaxID=34254 RepID=A0AAV3PWE0_LITER
MIRRDGDRVLRDANFDVNDHLSGHIHLTNCIHLKNHMHKHSPVLADQSLRRDLAALQRSRSLRDPSMSPSAWQSPSIVEALLRRGERDSGVEIGTRSIGVDRPADLRGVLGSSPTVPSEHSNQGGLGGRARGKREVSSKGHLSTDAEVGGNELPGTEDRLVRKNFSGNSQGRDNSNQQTGRIGSGYQPRTLSQQLEELLRNDSDDAASSRNHVQGSHVNSQRYRLAEEVNPAAQGQRSYLARGRRRKFRSARKNRASTSRDAGALNEISVASNSLHQGSGNQIRHHIDGDENYANPIASRGAINACGIPFNWSRIHHRGKSFLDRAGRSLSCGLSDSKLRNDGSYPRGKESSGVPVTSYDSGSSSKSGAEAFPLLLDPSVSQGSSENAAWVHDYSGELGIYADNLLNHEIDSDLASEARSAEQHKRRGNGQGRHRSLTEKYTPRTFRDLVGQHLVVQALSNAAVKKKVGLLYVFYGPHGTGKTSTARIFARALNCRSLEHPKPCGVCNSCVAHDMRKSRNIREIGPLSNFDFESIMNHLDYMIVSQHPSHYRTFIFDDCDTLTPDSWSAIVKVIDRAPRHLVFVLVCSSLDVLPHIIISRCQKFFFPKLKDADIIYALQWIATNEDLDIDKDALKLIASKSDGSLRDAEMTLEQLSLLGQKISVSLVQEMAGLVSDEKLVDLLDLALSADTVNTVKNLREITESGVEPLALMSQLATVITDILAGGYNFNKQRHRRKFFRRHALSREDMEKLRQALKTLSEAEKQLRTSNDRMTWLTAALLQLAPDQLFMLPSSSSDTIEHTPIELSDAGPRQKPRKSNAEYSEKSNRERNFPGKDRIVSQEGRSNSYNAKRQGTGIDRPHQANSSSNERNRLSVSQLQRKYHGDIGEVWLDVLEHIQINNIREFLYREGKLISVIGGAALTVQLAFSSNVSKSTAENVRSHILQAFEAVLGSPVIIEMQGESRNEVIGPIILPGSQNGTSQLEAEYNLGGKTRIDSSGIDRSEIEELEASPKANKGEKAIGDLLQLNIQNRGSSLPRGTASVRSHSSSTIFPDQRHSGGSNRNMSLVKSKVSLAHVIQQAEGCTLQRGWSKRKAVSIAEKLEQENLRLEPRSRGLLCWKSTKINRRKPSRLKIRTRKTQRLLRLMTCGRCISSRSPR